MKLALFLFAFFPLPAMAQTPERTQVACLDELQKYEFTPSAGEIVPDSYWQTVSIRFSGDLYEWNGRKIVKQVFVTDETGFTKIPIQVKIWSRQRLKYNDTGKSRSSPMTASEVHHVLNLFISKAMTSLHERVRWGHRYSTFSVGRILEACGEVSEVRVRVRPRRWVPIAHYRNVVRRFHPELFK